MEIRNVHKLHGATPLLDLAAELAVIDESFGPRISIVSVEPLAELARHRLAPSPLSFEVDSRVSQVSVKEHPLAGRA